MSVDILSFFKQLLPVLENDKSVYCISAWNDQVSPTIDQHLYFPCTVSALLNTQHMRSKKTISQEYYLHVRSISREAKLQFCVLKCKKKNVPISDNS